MGGRSPERSNLVKLISTSSESKHDSNRVVKIVLVVCLGEGIAVSG